MQDSDGHWYWIPLSLVDEFENEEEILSGVDYMDNPDAFDDFIDKYEVYRTYGSPDCVPTFYENK
jgi:hypothetical protein